MSERAKLSFDDLSKPKKREKPDLALLRQLSEDHGFPSRDPVSAQDGEGEVPPADSTALAPPEKPAAPASTPIAAPEAAPVTPQVASAPVAAPPPVPAPAAQPSVLPDPTAFRRRGRPPSDRLYPMNIKVSQEVAAKLYELRDARPRQTFADVLEMLLDVYDAHGGDPNA